MRYFSHTQLNLYGKCPAQYKCRYIDKVPEGPSRPRDIGRMVHEVIAAYDMHLLRNRLQTDITELPKIMDKVFFAHPSLGPSEYDEVRRIIESFGQSHVFRPDLTVGIEERIEVDLDQDTKFVGIVDRLEIDDNVAVIADYKTDWRVRPASEIVEDFQLQIYAWLVSKWYPQVASFRVHLEFVRHSYTPKPVEIDWWTVQATEKKVRGFVKQIQEDTKFKPKPGEGCAWCSYVEQCPYKIDNNLTCTSQTDAQRLAEEITLLEERVRSRKSALKVYCDANGPVKANGLEWGYRINLTDRVEDAKAFYEAMVKAGADPWDFLAVDSRQLRKLIESGLLPQSIEPLLTDSASSRFAWKKVG